MSIQIRPPGKGGRVKRVLPRLCLAALIILALLSVTPYLIPPAPLEGNRFDFAFPNSRFSDVEGVGLHLRLWQNDGGGRGNVLLVHGFGGSTFSWRYAAPALSEAGYHVAAVDLPGFGLSERRGGLDHSQQGRAALLWALLEELAPGERWHLVGHSMGGGTIAAMALARPEAVKSTVYAAGAVTLERGGPGGLLLRYPPVRQWFRVLAPRLMRRQENIERLVSSAYGRPATAEEVSGYYLPVTVAGSDAVLLDLQQQAEAGLVDALQQLDLPALLLWGEEDRWVPLSEGEKLARLLPGALLEILPGEGHCPMETAPEVFHEILLEFLEKL